MAGENAVLSILRQEKTPREAWWTCEHCPQRIRWLEGHVWDAIHSYPIPQGATRSLYPVEVHRGNEWEVPDAIQWATVKRCRSCMRKRDRHHRMVKSLKDVLKKQMEIMGSSARFVTLTVPNEFISIDNGVIDPDDLAKLARNLKKKMYAFSRTVAYKDKVLGAVEVYEQTYTNHGDSLEVNTHIHAVWLGSYWKQEALQEAWGGVVHITKPKSKKAVIRYISKYITKDPIPGTRAKETRGILRT